VFPGISKGWFGVNLTGLTINMWTKPASSGDMTAFGAKNHGVVQGTRQLHIKQTTGDNWDFSISMFSVMQPVSLNAWQMLTMAVDEGSLLLRGYKDGIVVKGTRFGSIQFDYDPVIGHMAGETEPGYFFDGLIDEFRVSSVERSSNWVWAVWANMNPGSTFVGYSAVETPPGGGPADDDMDDMADEWEIVHFASTNATSGGANDDFDGDGYLNVWEYIAGTDPTDRESYFALSITLSNGQWVVTFPALEAIGTGYTGLERRYDLEDRTNLILGDWMPVIDYTNLLGNDSEVIRTNASQRIYYRSRAKLQ
jgi:hypothetical protein